MVSFWHRTQTIVSGAGVLFALREPAVGAADFQY